MSVNILSALFIYVNECTYFTTEKFNLVKLLDYIRMHWKINTYKNIFFTSEYYTIHVSVDLLIYIEKIQSYWHFYIYTRNISYNYMYSINSSIFYELTKEVLQISQLTVLPPYWKSECNFQHKPCTKCRRCTPKVYTFAFD